MSESETQSNGPNFVSKLRASRRKWATERKDLPDVDVARYGGWQSLEALKQSYQQADVQTLVEAMLGARAVQ